MYDLVALCDYWCNAEGGQKDNQDWGFICFRGPIPRTLL